MLESTDNACSTSFLFIDELRSIIAVYVHSSLYTLY